MEETFTKIYEKCFWGGSSSNKKWNSGSGSSDNYKEWYSNTVMNVIIDNNVENVCSIGCGDWNLDSSIDWDEHKIKYLGIDIVQELIEDLSEKYSSEYKEFIKLDVTTDEIPKTDLFIVKDVMQHWKCKHIYNFLNKAVHHSKFILLINCGTKAHDFSELGANGGFRHLSHKNYPL